MAPLVEARRDGRLGERESASLARHLVACAACRELASDLERLAGLAGRPAAAKLTPLEQRRQRLRLLRDAAFAPASRAGTRPRVQIVRLAAAAAVILGVLAGGTALAILALPSAHADRPSPPSGTDSSPPLATETRSFVAAPFAATVAEPSVAAPPTAATAAVADEVAPVVVAPRAAAPRPRTAAGAPSAQGIVAAKLSDGTSALADGVELIERGDYGAAAERLGAFRQSHPGDVRAQDAAFLAVLALERAGRHAAAVAAAREYLTSYPQGYRRAEAQAIVAAP